MYGAHISSFVMGFESFVCVCVFACVCIVCVCIMYVCGEAFQIVNVRETFISHAENFAHGHGAFFFSIRGES